MKITYLLLAFLIPFDALDHNEENYDVELFCQDINVILQRVNIASFNIANHKTTRTAKGGPFKRELISSCKDGHCKIEIDQTPPMLHYIPDHPDANKMGYVAFPNFSVLEEKAKMMKAQNAYNLIIAHMPVFTKDLVVGNKLNHCFENYQYFKEQFDFKSYLGR
ncbi:MAG: hypothetical protein HOE90_13360 [Bacteriovoracaceae bacterium]|jgi:flagellar basal-body rod protein FlgC|nr:hypothetical protein [Bacteriovoracaceae bacterium]